MFTVAAGTTGAHLPVPTPDVTAVLEEAEARSASNSVVHHAQIEMVTATAQPILIDTTDVELGLSGVPSSTGGARQVTDAGAGGDESTVQTSSSQRRRGEFLSATVVKPSKETRLGIQLCQDTAGDVRISFLRETGVLFQSPLRVGDKIVSINGKSCFDMDHNISLDILKEAVGFVTIIVHNVGGDPKLVETMVEKISPRSPVGLGIRRNAHASLEISKIAFNSIFTHSLMNIGDRLLAINGIGCERMDPRAAIELIRSSPQYVTMVTETQQTTGVVLATNASARAEMASAVMAVYPFAEFSVEDDVIRFRQHACFCMWMIILSLLILSAIMVGQK